MRVSVLLLLCGVGLAGTARPSDAPGTEPSGVSAEQARLIESRRIRQSRRLFAIPAGLAQQALSSDATGIDQDSRDKDRDGLSDAEEARLGTDRLLADTDGDALLDGWEVKGVNRIDLRALGASPLHKDIFVEMDYMEKPGHPGALRPSEAVKARIVAIFAGADVPNPDGASGIAIHLLDGNEVAYDDDLNLKGGEFDALKAVHFAAERAPVFHYMIWANGYAGGDSSGYSMTIPGSDFIVTLGKWDTPGGTDDEKVGTFIHELGHNLGLRHGSTDDDNHKPNHLSVMNYSFQTVGIPTSGGPRFDFQSFRIGPLRETALNEGFGIGTAPELRGYSTIFYDAALDEFVQAEAGGAIDWDGDGTATGPISADLNGDASKSALSSGTSEWGRLFFGGGSIGRRNALQSLFGIAKAWAPEAPQEELKPSDVTRIRQRRIRD